MTCIGVVAIGRNEGDRLKRCLASLAGRSAQVVYVDSGSTDGSVDHARSQGVDVVELDMTKPFTAARARNAGYARLKELRPDVQYVQFVDGDCEVAPDWLEKAAALLDERPDVAAVCGRRKERFPEATIYNTLCDIEWNLTPPGETDFFGGDVLIRAATFEALGGYRPEFIAGEDPELAFRVRKTGGKIIRMDMDMTIHDAAMTRFSQWWKRTRRGGYAYMLQAFLHGRDEKRFSVRETRRTIFWAAVVPLVAIAAAWWTWGLSLLLLPLAYVALFLKVWRGQRRLMPPRQARIWAFFCVLGKFPEFAGQISCRLDKAMGRTAYLIEYKGPEGS